MVESGGDINAVGDGGLAIGPFQIQEAYWSDAVEYDPSLKSGGKTYQNCKGEGSVEYSERVMQVSAVLLINRMVEWSMDMIELDSMA